MSGQLQVINNATLGFLGLNTQEAGVTLESGYATKAVNCVIDKSGRLGSRRGWESITTNRGTLGATNHIEGLYEFLDIDRASTIISTGNNKFYSGTTTLSEIPIQGSVTISGNRWQFCQLSEGAGYGSQMVGFAAQANNPMLCYRKENGTGSYVLNKIGVVGTAPTLIFDPDCCLAAYGRVWAAGVTGAKTTVFFSQLLDGITFTGVGAGFLDISAVVRNNDEVVALAAHNGFLVIFCKNNVVIYRNPTDPTSAEFILEDVIVGVGCLARDSVQNTGSDLIFLSKEGVKSLNRLLREKSLPMRDLSLNIRDDLLTYISGEVLTEIKSVYFERDAFYLLVLPGLNQSIYFDMRQQLENGASRTTIWDWDSPKALLSTSNRELYLGMEGTIGKYFGYSDNGADYRLEYFTQNTDAGAPSRLKFLKKAKIIVIAAGSQDIIVKYAFDYSQFYNSRTFTRNFMSGISEYNIAEYGVGEYSAGTAMSELDFNLGGSGKVIQFGVEIPIEGSPVSLQQLGIYLKLGKLI